MIATATVSWSLMSTTVPCTNGPVRWFVYGHVLPCAQCWQCFLRPVLLTSLHCTVAVICSDLLTPFGWRRGSRAMASNQRDLLLFLFCTLHALLHFTYFIVSLISYLSVAYYVHCSLGNAVANSSYNTKWNVSDGIFIESRYSRRSCTWPETYYSTIFSYSLPLAIASL